MFVFYPSFLIFFFCKEFLNLFWVWGREGEKGEHMNMNIDIPSWVFSLRPHVALSLFVGCFWTVETFPSFLHDVDESAICAF